MLFGVYFMLRCWVVIGLGFVGGVYLLTLFVWIDLVVWVLLCFGGVCLYWLRVNVLLHDLLIVLLVFVIGALLLGVLPCCICLLLVIWCSLLWVCCVYGFVPLGLLSFACLLIRLFYDYSLLLDWFCLLCVVVYYIVYLVVNSNVF